MAVQSRQLMVVLELVDLVNLLVVLALRAGVHLVVMHLTALSVQMQLVVVQSRQSVQIQSLAG